MIADGRRRLRVAVLFSHRAPGLDYVLEADPGRGPLYELVACVTSEPANAEHGRLAEQGVPLLAHDIHAFHQARGAPLSDPDVRRAYDAAMATLLEPFAPDLVVLCAYLYLVGEPLLGAFEGRIVNIHDADLRLRDADGRPRYPGLHAVRDAILAGEKDTRSTVHMVTADLDAGPVVTVSRAFPVHQRLVREACATGATDALKAYAYAHREWMMRLSWGPLLSRVLEKAAMSRNHRLLRERPQVAPRALPPAPAEP